MIFLDIILPGMDGHAVARRIRAEAGMEKTPLLALTGWGRACDKQASQAAGFDRHLVKPVEPKELRRLLAHLVEGLNAEDCQGKASSRGEEHWQVSRAHFPGAT
jgi:CheY-like chemotaxis protein